MHDYIGGWSLWVSQGDEGRCKYLLPHRGGYLLKRTVVRLTAVYRLSHLLVMRLCSYLCGSQTSPGLG